MVRFSGIVLVGVLVALAGCAEGVDGEGAAGDEVAEVEEAIVGGTVDNAGTYVGVGAAVWMENWNIPLNRENTVCTGTLIHPEWVLTAGHCLYSECMWGTGALKERCKWYFGYTDVQTAPTLQGRGVSEIHSFYLTQPCQGGYTTCQSDVALMKIYPPVTNVAPRKLATPTEFSTLASFGGNVRHVGYGCSSNTTGAGRGYRRHGTQYYYDSAQGAPVWPYTLVGPGTLFTVPNPITLCQADSGGPALDNYSGRQLGVQYGIFAMLYGGYGTASVHLRTFLMWIHRTVPSLPCDSGRPCNDRCGDAICDASAGENATTCGYDCVTTCNGRCEFPRTVAGCPSDCSWGCGNYVCDYGETAASCPADCAFDTIAGTYLYTCGDGSCTGEENPTNCPGDCSAPACPNGVCDPGETPSSCALDCPGCGDLICDPFLGEFVTTCSDCYVCPDGICSPGEEFTCFLDCP